MHKLSTSRQHSIRLQGYYYSSPGAYFVTIVTQRYKNIFGRIIHNEMQLNVLGNIVNNCWLEILDHCPGMQVEPFVVMPNHIHGVITIIDEECRGTIYRAPTSEKFGKPVKGSIPTIVRTYKAAVSRMAKRELGIENIWQRNYYEHIIRDEKEYEDIWNYVQTNPINWMKDKLIPESGLIP
jgi:putative transposase